MSANNVIDFPGAFYLFGDSAHHDDNAVISRFGQKILPVPSARSAIGFSGYIPLWNFVCALVSGARSIDDLRSRVETTATSFALENGGYGKFSQSFRIAGFSEEGAQELWDLNFKPTDTLYPKFVKQPPGRWKFTPAVQLQVDVGKVKIDPESFCIDVLNRQRAEATVVKGWNGGQPAHIVGGDGILVTVTRDSITQKILTRWPDKAGRPIIVEA